MILNRQKKVRLATRPLDAFLRKTKRELKIADAEITIAFVSDEEIAHWNEAYRKKVGPTDVLSFPAMAGAKLRSTNAKGAAETQVLGDIAISPETAKRYAKKNGRTLGKELRVLILHGALHLMGYDHESDRGEMNRIERRLRRRLGIA
jgi:probable rRNA maturation factor